jgi:hypothetical protein
MMLLSLLERLMYDTGGPGVRACRLGRLKLVRPTEAVGELRCEGVVTAIREFEGRIDVDVEAAISVEGVTTARTEGQFSLPRRPSSGGS